MIVHTSQTQKMSVLGEWMVWNEDLIPTVKLVGRDGVEMEVIGKRFRKSRQQQQNPKEKTNLKFYVK